MSEEVNTVPVVDDEMPAPPVAGDVPQGEIASEVTGDIFAGVAELGEAMPKGTYHFRLDKTFLNWNSPEKGSDEERLGAQPNYGILWSCQQEPHTGKTFMDSCPWVNKGTLDAAAKGDGFAQQVLRKRLVRAKAIIVATGYPMSSGFSIDAFFAAHPEVKILLGVQEKKQKDPGNPGKYVGTGQMVNNSLKYISVSKPA